MASQSAEPEAAPGMPTNTPGPYPQPGMGKDQIQYPQEPPPAYVPPPNGPPQAGQQYPGAYPPGQQPYPPAQGYYPQQGGPTTVVVTQPRIAVGVGLGLTPYPIARTCPNCHATGVTNVYYTTGGMTWLSAGLLCLFCCWCGCQCIPFCMDSTKDAVHRCSNCDSYIGIHHRL